MLSANKLGIATVAYADIFDFPLTQKEFHLWSIGRQSLPVSAAIEKKKIAGTQYLCLPARASRIKVRSQRRSIAVGKWQKAHDAAKRFRWIPTVKLVGVTGGLSVDNAKKEDDIDFFFIVSKGALWMTRLLVTLTAELTHMRRRPGESKVQDKICLNMFMTEDALGLPATERDLFAAHEVLQMTPLWESGGAHRRFLAANRWVRIFLPNAWEEKSQILNVKSKSFIANPNINKPQSLLFRFSIFVFRLFESLAKILQLRYMQKRRTTEVIEAGVLRFHPRDARRWVKAKYASRLNMFDIPLDSVFYSR